MTTLFPSASQPRPFQGSPHQARISRRRFLSCVPPLGAALLPAAGINILQAQPAHAHPVMPDRTPFPLPALAKNTSPVVLPNSYQLDVQDAAGHPRRIFVAVPPQPEPATGYPVLMTTDANVLFGLFAALVQQQAVRPDPLSAVTPVIVGIGYPLAFTDSLPLRKRDYTIDAPPSAHALNGGADNLLDFMQHSLQPWLAQQLPINPRCQALFGHSHSGLFALYALFTRPSMFQTYTAASPSIWWNDRIVLQYARRFIDYFPSHAANSPPHLLLTAGSLEEGAPQPDAERRQRQQQNRMVSSARDLSAMLQGHSGIRSRFVLLDGEDHGSVTTRSAALALRELAHMALAHKEHA